MAIKITGFVNWLKGWFYDKSEIDTKLADKQNLGDYVTSISLIPKSNDNTGAIRLYYGDE